MGVSIKDCGPWPVRSLGEDEKESLIIQVKWQAKGWRAFAAEADAVCVRQSSGGPRPRTESARR